MAALRHPLGIVNRGDQTPMTRVGQVASCNDRSRSSSPSQRLPTLPDPVLNTVIVLKMCWKTQLKKSVKKYSVIHPQSFQSAFGIYANLCAHLETQGIYTTVAFMSPLWQTEYSLSSFLHSSVVHEQLSFGNLSVEKCALENPVLCIAQLWGNFTMPRGQDHGGISST